MTTRTITLAALFLSGALGTLPGLAEADDVTCRRLSDTLIHCNDGRNFSRHGDRLVDNEGNTWRRHDNGDGDP
jgi:hypothetical protein